MADNSSIILGGLGGAATGAAIGTELLPGVGTVIGAALGGGLGLISGGKKQKDIEKAMAGIEAIPGVDPNMIDFKDQLLREKRAVESGFSTEFQVARDIIGQSEAGGMSVAAELAMTNPALALMTMNQVSNQADLSTNKALGTIATKSMGYTQMVSDLIEKISQRKLDVEMMKAEYKMGQAVAVKKDFNANAMALLSKFGPKVLDLIPGKNTSGSVSDLITNEDKMGMLENLESGNFFNPVPDNSLIPTT